MASCHVNPSTKQFFLIIIEYIVMASCHVNSSAKKLVLIIIIYIVIATFHVNPFTKHLCVIIVCISMTAFLFIISIIKTITFQMYMYVSPWQHYHLLVNIYKTIISDCKNQQKCYHGDTYNYEK